MTLLTPLNLTSQRQKLSTQLASGLLAASIILSTGAAIANPHPEALTKYQQAMDAYIQGNHTQAIQLFEQSSKVDPTFPDTYFNLGTLYYEQQNFAAAERAYRQAVALRPSDHESRYNLALSYEKQRKMAQAKEVLAQIPAGDKHYTGAQQKIQLLTQQIASQGKTNTTTTTAKAPVVETIAKDFSGPTGIAIANNGTLYVANYAKNEIEQLMPNGTKQVFAKEHINGPVGLVYHPGRQEFFVANYLGNSIARISANGKSQTMVSNLKKPYYLNLDTVNNILYVSEQESNTVSRIRL